jgi:hypothetical protein
LILAFLEYTSKTFRGRSHFSTSFSEGTHLSTLEVHFVGDGDSLGFNDFLISIDDIDGQATYVFASQDKNKIINIYTAYKSNPHTKRLQLHL